MDLLITVLLNPGKKYTSLMSRCVTKPTVWALHPMKAQFSLEKYTQSDLSLKLMQPIESDWLIGISLLEYRLSYKTNFIYKPCRQA